MYSFLIIIIYLAFISLGLPDSLLGAGWPAMQPQMGVPLSYAGIISMIIAGGTIVSSLLSDRLTKQFGVGLVTAASVSLTSAALFGFSASGAFFMLCLWGVPYGLGAGAVDAALNNYVALHYTSRHMNWLHCFWGVGASVSPYIMSCNLTKSAGWNGGYRTVSIIQVVLTAALFLSLPLWKAKKTIDGDKTPASAALKLSQILRIKGVCFILLAFFSYCAAEATMFLWACSYLVSHRGINAAIAARYASLFFIGITAGRFLSGLISDRIGDRNMIRIGIGVIFAGVTALSIPISVDWLCLYGLLVMGLGCAPIYPAIIHSTPANFGDENSQAIIGVQMACAYIGSTFIPPLFGVVISFFNIGLLPVFISVFACAALIMTERLNAVVSP